MLGKWVKQVLVAIFFLVALVVVVQGLVITLYLYSWVSTVTVRLITLLILPSSIGLGLAFYVIRRLCVKRRVSRIILFLCLVSVLTALELTSFLLLSFNDEISTLFDRKQDVKVHVIDHSDWIAKIQKRLDWDDVDFDFDPDPYEVLGWADARTVVYRRWQRPSKDLKNSNTAILSFKRDGGGVQEHDKVLSSPESYNLDQQRQTAFIGDLKALSYHTCSFSTCIQPLLKPGATVARDRFSDPVNLWNVVLSPDERWAAFLIDSPSNPLYGDYYLVIVSTQKPSR